MAVADGSLTQLEPVLDAVPTPLLLIEPGTARVLYVNPAAHRLAGGRMEKAGDADYASVYGVFDPSGRRLASEEHPGVRAARGERFQNVPVDWVTPAGRRLPRSSQQRPNGFTCPHVCCSTREPSTRMRHVFPLVSEMVEPSFAR